MTPVNWFLQTCRLFPHFGHGGGPSRKAFVFRHRIQSTAERSGVVNRLDSPQADHPLREVAKCVGSPMAIRVALTARRRCWTTP